MPFKDSARKREHSREYYRGNPEFKERSRIYGKRWRELNRETRQRTCRRLQWKYQGLNDIEKAQELWDNVLACQLCGATNRKFNIDHDHTNGQVRGKLCERCNKELGCFSDNSELLRKAADYVERTPDVPEIRRDGQIIYS